MWNSAPREQLVYTMFITNTHISFHLCWKENLITHEKFPKYYDHDCLQFFFLGGGGGGGGFMSLLTAPIVKNSDIFAGIYFIFLEERHWSNSKVLQYQICTLAISA